MPTWSPGAGPSTGNDVFTGDATADVASALAGSDTLSGFGGADALSGGDGDDIIYGYASGASSAINSTVLVSGLAAPVAASTTTADPGFLYIVEKETGIIWRVNADTGAKTQFVDIPDSVFAHDGERGVLGLAFHPDYASNGRFFVYLTDAQGDIQIREFHRSAGNPLIADTTSTLVIEVPHPTFGNHNDGWIGFSPVDGDLYFGTGDDGSGGDPNNHAQDLNSLLGKIIRIDVNSDAFPGDATRNYAIPATNPFVGVTGADEIWAYGVRNPWRMAFDPRNGDLYVADVGQDAREEVDYIAAGHAGVNLGWRIMEGNLPYNPGPPGTPQPGDPSLTLPIYDYGRTVGTTITGGEIYTGSVTGFVGQYVFADFGSGRLFSLSVADGAAVDPTDRTNQLTGSIPSSLVDFVTSSSGALFAVGIGGTIWRLDPGAGAADAADTLNGDAGNDTLIGGAGADILNGGIGFDRTDFAAASTSSSWHRNPNGSWTITAGTDGTDTLTSVERAHFTDRDVFLDAAKETFTGDGTSDILFRNSGGQVATWAVAGSTITGQATLGFVDNTWSLATTGDFNGDGKADLLWLRNDGVAVAWQMDGAAISDASVIGNVGTSWHIAGSGDFNQDGMSDIVWRNDGGAIAVWTMNGATPAGSAVLGAVDNNWSIAAVADLNGDGRDEIIWRHSSGVVATWRTDGAAITGADNLGVVDSSWTLAGTGDFNNDGRADLLWLHNGDGAAAIWDMNGASILASASIGTVGPAWHVANVGDYNGDGNADILWRNDNGALAVWVMNGFSVTSSGVAGYVDGTWGII